LETLDSLDNIPSILEAKKTLKKVERRNGSNLGAEELALD